MTWTAFAASPHGDHGEHRIVRALRERGRLTTSLVGERDNALIGHAAASPVRIDGADLGWS